ncbi:polymer-forming cytoskeletal protein [Phenylobacterium sp.]|uniref:bactofilin family protein n=1 Tax=Phenylobacterium sp. TaxID=1871053 RepID=UPI002E35C641|nr:polymer-forming cytoskeletal protein [Phenylobacterium sp.]HEX2560308.1 polymer-forming cytoskeletal protein [Phenylobacterium sp.]
MFGKPAKPPAAPPQPTATMAPPAVSTVTSAQAPAADPAPKPESVPVALTDNLSNNLRKSPVAASLIAENMTLEGAITAEGELHVDGTIRGEVRVTRLTIGDSGHIEGTITAETVEVRGKIVGAVTAKQIRLASSAHVDGDVTHEQLAIEAGAFFQGRSLKFQRQAAPAAVTGPRAVEKPADKPITRPEAVAS